jgi:hypothetical protein
VQVKSQPKVVRVPAEVARNFRAVARLAGMPVEELYRAAFIHFAALPSALQQVVLWDFLTTADQQAVDSARRRRSSSRPAAALCEYDSRREIWRIRPITQRIRVSFWRWLGRRITHRLARFAYALRPW